MYVAPHQPDAALYLGAAPASSEGAAPISHIAHHQSDSVSYTFRGGI